jgi:RHS repeat-associated protein
LAVQIGAKPLGYDAAGNVNSYNDSAMGTWIYGYDALNRLVSGQNTATTGTSTQYAGKYLCWAYDSFGNRTTQNLQSSSCSPTMDVTAAFNEKNQVVWTTVNSAVNGFSYDASGNVTSDYNHSYLYDAEGHICAEASTYFSWLTMMTGYVYDADGNRVAKGAITKWSCDPSVNGIATAGSETDYVLGPGGEQIAEMAKTSNGAMAWQRGYVYAGSMLLGTYSPASDASGQPQLSFRLTDWLGTMRTITDSSGVLQATCTGLPFGDVQSCQGNVPDPRYFTGKERDSESGNDYFGARYYASSMGRWLSPDWAAMATPVPYAKLSDPQTLNLYAYVGNNPLTRFDADGHTITCTGNQCKQYIAALQKATGMTFAADKNGLLSITSKPDKMGYVGSAVAGVIGDKKDAVNISADSNNNVLGGHYAGHGNQILNFNSINALSSAKGGFTPQSIVTHETMEAYVGLKLGGAYDMATYSKAHAAAIGYENAERLSEGLPARIDEYGSGSNGTFHGTINFSFWKEHFDVTNGTSVSNVTSERTNQPGQTIQ